MVDLGNEFTMLTFGIIGDLIVEDDYAMPRF